MSIGKCYCLTDRHTVDYSVLCYARAAFAGCAQAYPVCVLPPKFIALALAAALVLVLQFARPAQEASALAPRLALPHAVCSGASATVSFSWTPVPGAIDQWLDVSLVDDDFQPGTAATSGALNSSQSSLGWLGLAAGFVHYWRVNARMDGGWATSMTGAFVPCGGPALLWGPMTCHGPSSASVHFRWAPMAIGAVVQYLDVGFDPSFAPGTFAAAGPMDPATDRYFWDGLRTDAPYFFRVTALGSDGVWRATAVAGFTANCAGQPAFGDGLYGSNDRLVFSRLGIEAPVNVRDVGNDGIMGNPAGAWDVVRYNFPWFDGFGAYPGDGGTAVVAGHVDYRPNIMAVFWELRRAQQGDVIGYYRGDGVRVRYSVDWVQQVDSSFDVNGLIARTPTERLVLITCDGSFNPVTREYDLRFLLVASRQY